MPDITTPVTCPVCHGVCTMPSSFYNPSPEGVIPASTTCEMRETCRSCWGQGVVYPDGPRHYPYMGALNWQDLVGMSGPFTGHLTIVNEEGDPIVDEALEIMDEVTPAVPHDDLKVRHEVEEEVYTARLLNPDGSVAAPDLVFHRGSPEEGWHGWTTATVLQALIEHMEYHQSTAFACLENGIVLMNLRAAHEATKIRAERRKERGVLYNWKKP